MDGKNKLLKYGFNLHEHLEPIQIIQFCILKIKPKNIISKIIKIL